MSIALSQTPLARYENKTRRSVTKLEEAWKEVRNYIDLQEFVDKCSTEIAKYGDPVKGSRLKRFYIHATWLGQELENVLSIQPGETVAFFDSQNGLAHCASRPYRNGVRGEEIPNKLYNDTLEQCLRNYKVHFVYADYFEYPSNDEYNEGGDEEFPSIEDPSLIRFHFVDKAHKNATTTVPMVKSKETLKGGTIKTDEFVKMWKMMITHYGDSVKTTSTKNAWRSSQFAILHRKAE